MRSSSGFRSRRFRRARTAPPRSTRIRRLQKLVADAARELGGLDVLVNCAARQFSRDSILDISSADFDETFKTNVYAMFWLTKAAVPLLPPGSTIINTASINAYDPGENIIDHAATKGAIMIFILIMIFTRRLAKKLAPKGIRVNAIAPGPVWTPLQVKGGQPESKIPSFGKDTPMGRSGQPAELAALYVLFGSPESSYSTGQVFAAVGGREGPDGRRRKLTARRMEPMAESARQKRIAGRVMHEFKHGELKSGPGGKGGPVQSRKQARAARVYALRLERAMRREERSTQAARIHRWRE